MYFENDRTLGVIGGNPSLSRENESTIADSPQSTNIGTLIPDADIRVSSVHGFMLYGTTPQQISTAAVEPSDPFGPDSRQISTIRDLPLCEYTSDKLQCGFEIDPEALCGFLGIETDIPYRLFHPSYSDPAIGIVVLPENNPNVKATLFEVREAATISAAGSLRDKVEQRNLAAEIGIFHQPQFVDLRHKTQAHSLSGVLVGRLDLTNFPIEDVISNFGTQQQYVVMNRFSGFVIKTGGGAFEVLSDNPKVLGCLAQCTEEEPSARLRQFIANINEGSFPQHFLRTAAVQNRRITADAIAAQRGTFYLKSTRTSGGQLVVRLSNDGALKIESDSPEFPDIVQRVEVEQAERFRNAERHVEVFSRSFQEDNPALKEARSRLERVRAEYNGPLPLLRALLKPDEMLHPILEREIPTIRINGERAEFRIICQILPESSALEVTASYAKVSDSDVAANISLGGKGERTLDRLKLIFAHFRPDLSADEQGKLAEESLHDLHRSTADFAQEFVLKYTERNREQYFQENLTDFAVDICPVWNATENKIEWYFLELQCPYGYQGLKDCDSNAAAQVAQRKEAIRAGQLIQDE